MDEVNYETINAYLHFWFVPKFGEGKWPFRHSELIDFAETPVSEDFETLIEQGVQTFERVFDKLTEIAPHPHHVVPLSAGLDSRFIIAALLDRIPPKKITAVTFGTPGTHDYEIPKQVSELTGINHEFIDATKVEFTFDKLIDAVKKGGAWTSTPDIWFNQKAMNIFGNREVNKWSGFIGDFIVGSYAQKGQKVNDVYKAYARYEKKCDSVSLTHQSYDSIQSLITPHIKKLFNLTEFELLALSNRIPSSTATICLHDDKEIIAPLVHPEWVAFMFRVPQKYRKGCKLFHAMMLHRFPDLMDVPTKNAYGASLGTNFFKKSLYRVKNKARKLKAVYKKNYKYAPFGVNYMYYTEAIRQHESLRKIITEACVSINAREITPWINTEKILQEHLTRKKDHTLGLLILLGLEVNLRAFEQTKK